MQDGSQAPRKVPDHVAILGMGPSLNQYLMIARQLGGRSNWVDEVWGINALGDVLQCDRVFHMDDVRIQQIRAEARPQSNIAAMLKWMRKHPGPIYTSRAHPDYPGLVEFPLEDVCNRFGQMYFNSTAAYAIAFALYIGVKHITIAGMDFTYDKAHDSEKGRGCVEYWLGFAAAHGVNITVVQTSSLLDACEPFQKRFYGYDTVELNFQKREDGKHRIVFHERDQATLPSADEIEATYDHSAHPNPLVSGQAA